MRPELPISQAVCAPHREQLELLPAHGDIRKASKCDS
jgi:hypothetical protein